MLAEMNVLKYLDHPNIIRLYELIQDERNYYLITEFSLIFLIFQKNFFELDFVKEANSLIK